jgi:hypothetical protein
MPDGETLSSTGAVEDEYTGEEVTASALVADPDQDGVVSATDNCAMVPNRDQADTDGDGFGDRCDPGEAVAPSVRLTLAPERGEVTRGSQLKLTASATDFDGAVMVRIVALSAELPTQSLFICTILRPPFECSWRPIAPGEYSLTAVATGNGGSTATSPNVKVRVK